MKDDAHARTTVMTENDGQMWIMKDESDDGNGNDDEETTVLD